MVVMRRPSRRARAPVAAAAEVVDAFCRPGGHTRQVIDGRWYPVDQPVGERAARRVRVEQLNDQFLGTRWWRAPLQAGDPVRAVAGELTRECAPRKVRAGDCQRRGIPLTGTVHCRTSTSSQRQQEQESDQAHHAALCHGDGRPGQVPIGVDGPCVLLHVTHPAPRGNSPRLRRSAHRSVTELEADIRTWVNEWNKNPKPFVCTKSADEILETLAAYCERINDSGH